LIVALGVPWAGIHIEKTNMNHEAAVCEAAIFWFLASRRE